MLIYCQNLLYAQKLQMRVYNKNVKPWSYALGKKVSLNCKYIKTKRNWKLKAKFFDRFRVLHPVKKSTYKLELPTKWRIYIIFHLLLLELDITKKNQVNDKLVLELEFNFKASKPLEYKVEEIQDSLVYNGIY